jgi:hypothetical protein
MAGPFHIEINYGMLLILSKAYPDFSLCFFGEKFHVEALEGRNSLKNAEFKAFRFFPDAVLKTLLLRDILGCFYSWSAFLNSKRSDILFFTNILPLTHLTIFLLNFFLRRNCFICLHGQVEAYMPNSRLRLTKYYFKLQLPIYKYDSKNMYVIFGDSIYAQIKWIFHGNSKCIVIDHPFVRDDNQIDDNGLNFPIIIGQIGVGDLGKGTQYLFELSDLLKEYILDSKLKICLVGKLNENLRHLDNGLVEWFDAPIPLIEFEARIKQLHFSLFFRDLNTGSVVASGSFMDAIKYLKPYLALKNPYIEFYNKRFTKSGNLYNDVGGMAFFISDFLDNPNRIEYASMLNSLKKLQNSLSLEVVTARFIEQSQ